VFALAGSAWLWHAGKTTFGGTMLAPLCLMLAPIAGFLALGVLVFNLRTSGPPQEDSGFGMLSERQGVTFGAVVVFLFGVALLAVAAKGLLAGAMPVLSSDPDIVFQQSPVRFLLKFSAWTAGGLALCRLAWKIARTPRRSEARTPMTEQHARRRHARAARSITVTETGVLVHG